MRRRYGPVRWFERGKAGSAVPGDLSDRVLPTGGFADDGDTVQRGYATSGGTHTLSTLAIPTPVVAFDHMRRPTAVWAAESAVCTLQSTRAPAWAW